MSKAWIEQGGTMKTKVDFYTKFILTVIAICLVWICIRDMDIIPKAYAAGTDDIVDVRIRAIERSSWEEWDSLRIEFLENMPVEVKGTITIPEEIKNELLPVEVKNVEVKRTLTPLKR
jgi:hypothetical protein